MDLRKVVYNGSFSLLCPQFGLHTYELSNHATYTVVSIDYHPNLTVLRIMLILPRTSLGACREGVTHAPPLSGTSPFFCYKH